MIRGKLSKIKERIGDFDDAQREKRRKEAGVDKEALELVIENAEGNSINRESLLRYLAINTVPFNLLDEDEQPHYLLHGSTIDVEGQGAGTESIIGWDRDRRLGAVYTIITDKRVLVVANHVRGYDEHTIPYDAITTVNLNSGLTSTRLSIQTTSATYHCSVSNTSREYGQEEEEQAVKYLRNRRQRENQTDSNSKEPLEEIEKLKSLYDDGVLTEEEFEEKKKSLLDGI